MTFGAMAAWQAWMLLGAAAAVAGALFLVKLRPPRMSVPSLLLWRRVLDESREQTLWERIRRVVSFALTVLIALALAMAAARPSARATGAAAGPGGRVLIVIDSSWSMQARTRSGETRWERAVAQARRLASAASGGVALATTADALVEGPTTDRALIDAALERIRPAGGESAPWPGLSDAVTVHFITDGALPRELDPGVVVHSVFEPAPNVAITAFDVRRPLDGSNAGDVYLEIANYAPSAQNVRLVLTRATTPLIDRRVELAAGESLRQAFPVPHGIDAILRARVEADDNALDVDDEAFATLERPRPLLVTIVGEQTAWLTALLENDPAVSAYAIVPSGYAERANRLGVAIFDRWAPQERPAAPALYFAPPPETPWLAGTADSVEPVTEERKPQWVTPGTHPVVRGVDPFTMIVERARAYGSRDLVPIARSARGTPLVYVSRPPGHRFVVVTFGPGESNLSAAPGFPVLVGDALEWLTRSPPDSERTRTPGLAAFDEDISTVTDPRGEPVVLARVNGGSMGALRTPGLYIAQGRNSRSLIAVNAGDPQISNVMRSTLSPGTETGTVAAGLSGRPWWMICAIAAFVLALIEWWTWQRRITL